jgi:hypothetical protein
MDESTFFKAVDVDGFDFYSHTVDYASICGTGESLPELPGGECCTRWVYHASTSAADTLIGGKWPCRLFKVSGEPVSEEDSKRGFKTLKVLEELPAWQAFGPNGQQVVEFMEKAKGLTQAQADSISSAYAGTYSSAVWSSAYLAAVGASWDDARGAAWDATWGAARDAERSVRNAVWDAANALLVRDLISEEHFNVLYAPCRNVMDV